MPEAVGRTEMKSKTFWVLLILVIMSVMTVAWMFLVPYIESPVRDLSYDIDWSFINKGLDRIHSFSDTGRWWTSTWCGEVPFWRPLTSYVFWIERLIWPSGYMLPRQIVSILLHLCFVLMAGILVWRLTRNPWVTLLTVYLFGGIRIGSIYPLLGSVTDTLSDPKNIPDPLVGMAMLISLMLLMNGRWKAALIAAMISTGFKETGYMTWFLAPLVLLWQYRHNMSNQWREYVANSIRRNLVPIITWTVVLIALAAIHYSAVGFGLQQGENRNWLCKVTVYHLGPVLNGLFTPNLAEPVIAILIATILIGFRRFSIILRLIGILIAVAIGVLTDVYIGKTSWEVSITQLLICHVYWILAYIVWLLLAWEARHEWQIISLTLAMSAITAAPTWFATQVLTHARYVSALFMEIAVAVAICRSISAVVNKSKARRDLV